MKRPHIVVIGGGVAGTAAAWRLRQHDCRVTIVEKEPRLGGRVCSSRFGDLMFEMGAGFLTDHYDNVLAFLDDNDLTDKLHERTSRAAIVRGGRQIPLASRSSLIGSGWLSTGAKLRLAAELLGLLPAWRQLDERAMWRASAYDTESIADRFHGKTGQEVLDYAIGPALDGYLFWAPTTTSRAVCMQILKAGFGRHRSYILDGGLQQIPEVAAIGSTSLLGHQAISVEQQKSGRYRITLDSGGTAKRDLYADGIVCATTATAVPRLFTQLTDGQQKFFESIAYSSTAVASYRLERHGTPTSLAVAYPRREGLSIGAMTVVSDLSPTADLVKLFANGADGPKLCSKDDAAIEQALSKGVHIDLSEARAAGAWRIQRWPEALPRYDVGHLRQLRAFVNGEIEIDTRIVFAGDYLGGPYIEGAFSSGIQAAERLTARFTKS